MNLRFDHIGIPVEEPQTEEFWVPRSKCWVTNPRTHPKRIEYLRFENKPDIDPELPEWKFWNMPYIAYRVDDLEEAVHGEEVIYGPFEPADFGTIVFVHKHGVVIEYLQYTDTETWFGQKTPWKPA